MKRSRATELKLRINSCNIFRMSAPRIFVALLFLAVSTQAQQPSPRPAYDGSGAPDVAREIHVDGNCRILPDVAHPLPHQKPRPFRDSNICHLEATNNSE